MISSRQVDLVQGEDDLGRPFGYVRGEEGGFFFTWGDSLASTLISVEEDDVDGGGGLEKDDVVAFLRNHLSGTRRGQRIWE